jgi:hypothetical protein
MSKVTSGAIRVLLRKRYRGDAWAIFDEVPNSTGYGRSRVCDMLVMSLWPSRGLELHGFEIKVTRADWLNEIRDPDKSEEFKKYCDRWWLVAPSRKILKDDLPADWGFMWVRKGKLVVSRGAPQLKPKPMLRPFLASILRCAKRASPGEEERKSIKQAAEEEARKRLARHSRIGVPAAQDKLERLQTSIAAFEEKSGIRIADYNGLHLGEEVALVNQITQFTPLIQRYIRLAAMIKAVSDTAQNSVAVIKKMAGDEYDS